MGKSTTTKSKSKGATDPLTKVKNAGVTKSAGSPKAKSKQVAKDVAAKGLNGKEKKKQAKKPVSDSDSDSDSESSADSSEDDAEDDSSDSSEDEKPKKKATPKKAAAAKAAATESSDSDSDSSEADSDDSSDSDEEQAPKTKANSKANGVAKATGAAKKDDSDSDSDSADSDDSSDSDEEEGGAKTKAVAADSDSDDSDSSDSSDSDAEEEKPKPAAEEPVKKRKALDDPVIPSKKARTEEASEKSSTLFVGSLAWAVNDDTLASTFSDLADFVSARVITDREGGRSRGFGYVDFSSPDGAAAALEAKQGLELEGRAMNIDFSGARPTENPRDRANNRADRHGDATSPESDTLFVGNLSFEIDQDSVRDFFATAGDVTGVRLPTDPESGGLKGFGYVTFSSIEEAKTAFNQLNGQYLGEGSYSRTVRLDFAGARPPPRDGGGRGGRGGFGGGRGDRGGFGGRGDRGGRGRGGRGGDRGGRGRGGGRGGFSSTNRGGLGDFSGSKITF